jgi:pyridoxine kinase
MANDTKALEDKRVLSIQSHVVHGYVGNNAAVFPLQILGYDVDTINSVQFSNHTGYSEFKGQVLNSEDLATLVTGLRNNHLLNYTHILTGYCGAKSFLEKIYDVITELKTQSPHCTFLCDPVLGDDGEMYVPRELIEVYRDRILPLADIITPNQYEMELLSGMKISSEDDVWTAIDQLLERGPGCVVATSIELDPTGKTLTLLGKTKAGEVARIEMPKIEGHFVGTGDLFSALLLAWSHLDLQTSCERTVGTMQAVLLRTLQYSKASSKPHSPETMELRLVQSKRDIETPPTLLAATETN